MTTYTCGVSGLTVQMGCTDDLIIGTTCYCDNADFCNRNGAGGGGIAKGAISAGVAVIARAVVNA